MPPPQLPLELYETIAQFLDAVSLARFAQSCRAAAAAAARVTRRPHCASASERAFGLDVAGQQALINRAVRHCLDDAPFRPDLAILWVSNSMSKAALVRVRDHVQARLPPGATVFLVAMDGDADMSLVETEAAPTPRRWRPEDLFTVTVYLLAAHGSVVPVDLDLFSADEREQTPAMQNAHAAYLIIQSRRPLSVAQNTRARKLLSSATLCGGYIPTNSVMLLPGCALPLRTAAITFCDPTTVRAEIAGIPGPLPPPMRAGARGLALQLCCIGRWPTPNDLMALARHYPSLPIIGFRSGGELFARSDDEAIEAQTYAWFLLIARLVR